MNHLLQVPADTALLKRLAYLGDCPVFFGHYWLAGTPQILTPKSACVDYSAGPRRATGGLSLEW